MNYKYSKFNIFVSYDNTTLLYNTLSEALIRLDNDSLNYFKEIMKKGNMSDTRFNTFLKNGFIVKESLDELSVLRMANRNLCYGGNTLNVTIAPTMACNMRCTYCFEHHYNEYMEKDTIDSTVSYIKKYLIDNKLEKLKVHWFGGEPLLCWETITTISRELMHFCDENSILYAATIISNGTLINEDIINQMIKYKIKSVQITIDGKKETHDNRRFYVDGRGTFDNIIDNLYYFNNKNISASIRVNIDKDNYKEFENVKRIINDMNFENISVYPALTESFPINDVSDKVIDTELFVESIMKKYRMDNQKWPLKYISCLAQTKHSFAIDPSGLLYKCWNQIGEKEYSYGSVYNGKINNYENLSLYMDNDITYDEKCSNCSLLPLCFGGCTYLRNTNNDKPCIQKSIA